MENGTTGSNSEERGVIVGPPRNFWIRLTNGEWDLTHPANLDSPPPDRPLHLECEISNVVIDPTKTALVIVDMQNFSMHPTLRKEIPPSMKQVEENLLKLGLPAAREAGIQVVWLNWGLTECDLHELSPAMLRVFTWRANSDSVDYGFSFSPGQVVRCGESRRGTPGPGDPLDIITCDDGTELDAGRTLMRDSWNAALHGPLADAFEKGKRCSRPDVLFHKNKNSGMCDEHSECVEFLNKKGIRTLLFAGVNTDQCVMATLQDAHAKGFDTILLRDASATDSPMYAQQSALYNCCRNWGFLSSCSALMRSVRSWAEKAEES